MLKMTENWTAVCETRMIADYATVIGKLPKALSRVAFHVRDSECGWEWKWFWLQNAVLFLEQDHRTRELPVDEDWSEVHEELFEAWNKSEHAKTLLRTLNKGQDLKAASTLTLAALQAQLVDLAVRHFGLKGKPAASHQKQFELGDFGKASLTATIDLTFERSVRFHTWDRKNSKKHVAAIKHALGVIKSVSPECFELFSRFTRSITPIQQKEFVSYSLQSLPGHSFINFYNRDELDLLDDLVHENGHHLLNLFLIQHDPLDEKSPALFYSPWRETLRPVRGIYHAHCTFFFALKLFHDLCVALDDGTLPEIWKLTKKQETKIRVRYLEEWLMLESSARALAQAGQKKLISPRGLELLNEYEKERRILGKRVRSTQQKISAAEKKKLHVLEKRLSENS